MTSQITGQAEAAAEAIRSIAHQLSGPVPAPELYEALAALRDTASRLEAVLPRLGGALERSLDAYEVRDSRDPARSVAACRARLDTAAELFGRAAVELDAAQNDIRDQGHS